MYHFVYVKSLVNCVLLFMMCKVTHKITTNEKKFIIFIKPFKLAEMLATHNSIFLLSNS